MSKKTSKSIPSVESKTFAKNRAANTKQIETGGAKLPLGPIKGKS